MTHRPVERGSSLSRTSRVLHDRWDILLVISGGGALGSLARWAVAEAFPHTEGQIAWGTWVANVSGGLLLGVLMVFVLDVWPTTRYLRPFLGVGVLGGYTTFSTYMLDTRGLLAHGQLPAALLYALGTLLTGLFAVWAGVLLARASVAGIRPRHRLERHSPPTGRVPDRATTPDPEHADEPRS